MVRWEAACAGVLGLQVCSGRRCAQGLRSVLGRDGASWGQGGARGQPTGRPGPGSTSGHRRPGRRRSSVVPGVYRCVCCFMSLNIQFRSALSRIVYQHTGKASFLPKTGFRESQQSAGQPGRLASCHVPWTGQGSRGHGAGLANACVLGRPGAELGPRCCTILPSSGSASVSAEVHMGNVGLGGARGPLQRGAGRPGSSVAVPQSASFTDSASCISRHSPVS